MYGSIAIDERRWREKVRRFEFEAKDLRTERDKLRAELNVFLGKPSAEEAIKQIAALMSELESLKVSTGEIAAENDTLTARVKELTNQVGGLKMTLGRYQKKDKG